MNTDQILDLTRLQRIRKVIIDFGDMEKSELSPLFQNHHEQIVLLHQVKLIVLSALLNLSKMLIEIADHYTDADNGHLSTARHELAIRLRVDANDILKEHMSKSSV